MTTWVLGAGSWSALSVMYKVRCGLYQNSYYSVHQHHSGGPPSSSPPLTPLLSRFRVFLHLLPLQPEFMGCVAGNEGKDSHTILTQPS